MVAGFHTGDNTVAWGQPSQGVGLTPFEHPSSNVVTTYYYNSGTGESTGTSYSDGTPSVTYYLNRLGHAYQVDDATGSRTFDLCACGRVNEEHFDSTFYGTRVLTYQYETSGGVVGRYKGFQLGSSGGSSADLEQTYSFTSGGRFDTLASKRASNSVSRTFQYGYLTNSSLVNALSITGGHAFSVARGYNGSRNLLESVDTKWSSTTQARFDYTYTNLMQRKTAKMTGPAFDDFYVSGVSGYSNVYNVYGYNDRGEVESAVLYRGNSGGTVTSTPSSIEELPGRHFEYRYDPIGNRTLTRGTASATADDEDYTTDGTNKYTAKENNVVRFAGTAGSSANVAVDLVPTEPERLDRAWAAKYVPANTSNAVKVEANVYAADPGGGSSGQDLVGSASKAVVVPKRSQGFDYDYAGNLLDDGLWEYAYDAENRLVSIQTHEDAINSGAVANADARRLEFKYDYLGRRVQKIVRSGRDSGTGIYGTELHKWKYLYDGWNLIAEFDALSTLTLVKSYTWGLDIAGSLTATGGVGALLQIRDHALSRTWLPAYDGNGNVSALLDAEAGSATIAAVYEYGPFGEPLRAEIRDADATDISFRFSTKFTDAETGLVYYGLRYYSPTLGKFINQDPISESGGLNLYGFVGNNGVNSWDYLGMFVQASIRESISLYGEQGNTGQTSGGGSEGSIAWAWSTGLGVAMDEMDSLAYGMRRSATNSGNWVQNMVARNEQTEIRDALEAASGGGITTSQASSLAGAIMNNGWDAVIGAAATVQQGMALTASAADEPRSSQGVPATSGAGSIAVLLARDVTVVDENAFRTVATSQSDVLKTVASVIGVSVNVTITNQPVSSFAVRNNYETIIPAVAAGMKDMLREVGRAGGIPVIYTQNTIDNMANPGKVSGRAWQGIGAYIRMGSANIALAHELGHYWGYRNNGSVHAPDTDRDNLMHPQAVMPNADQIYLGLLKGAATYP